MVISVICDALRFMFQMFWFFGPAILAMYCTAKTSNAIIGTQTLCAAGSVAAGVVGAAAIEILGIVMAFAVGLGGWLLVILLLFVFNRRIFLENALWIFGGFLMSEMPIIGAIPSMTVTMWRMHHTQITKERAALKKYEKENADEEAWQRSAQIAQYRIAKQSVENQQTAANEEVYAQAQAANEKIYDPSAVGAPAGPQTTNETGSAQRAQNESAGQPAPDQERDALRKRVDGWTTEIQRLEQQLKDKNRQLAEPEQSNRRLRQLKDSVWSANNKLLSMGNKTPWAGGAANDDQYTPVSKAA